MQQRSIKLSMVVALQATFLVELKYSQTNNNADIEHKIRALDCCIHFSFNIPTLLPAILVIIDRKM